MSELDDIVTSLRALGAGDIGSRIAKRAEVRLQQALEVKLGAGQAPDGTPWAPRKIGGRPYAHAAERIKTVAHGDLVRVTLRGPEVYGHFGARGMPVRQMLPDAGAAIPPIVTDAIEAAARDVFEEVTR